MTAAVFCLVCATWMFVGFVLEVFWFNFILNHDPSPVNVLLLCARAAFWPLIVMEKGVSGIVRVFGPYLKGVFLMKRKLFTTLLMLVLGGDLLPTLGYQPQIFSRVAEWWNAPPASPSPEAQKLIASLADGNDWKSGQWSDYTIVEKGNARVVLHTWHADVYIGGARANGSFTLAELRQVNDAAETCLRRLTAQALETATK